MEPSTWLYNDTVNNGSGGFKKPVTFSKFSLESLGFYGNLNYQDLFSLEDTCATSQFKFIKVPLLTESTLSYCPVKFGKIFGRKIVVGEFLEIFYTTSIFNHKFWSRHLN